MQAACTIVPDAERFSSGMFGYLDCQARTFGAAGYQALAAPGSTGSILLTATLTLFVAMVGYRMLLGETPTVRDGVLGIAKAGIVLALATSWPAFQSLIYNVAFDAPAQLASEIGGAARLPETRADLPLRLDGIDRAMTQLAIEGVGSSPVAADGLLADQPLAPPPFANFNAFALGTSRAIFIVSAIAAFGLVRLLAGLLLALGPVFITLLLFQGSRGLFEGWLRGLIGAALGAFATSVVLAIELALFEPWMAMLVARRSAELDIIGVPGQLLAAASVFAVILAALVTAVGKVAFGLKMPVFPSSPAAVQIASRPTELSPHQRDRMSNPPNGSRTRAAAIADAITVTQRREQRNEAAAVSTTTSGHSDRLGPAANNRLPATSVGPANGSRRMSNRVSFGARRRDRA